MSDRHDETAAAPTPGDAGPDLIAKLRQAGAFYPLLIGASVLVILLVAGIALAINPAPPRHVRLATGTAGGAYAATGEALRARLARDGVELELVPTSGSVENLALLAEDEGGVDAAIVQGGVGTAQEADAAGLESLGGLFYEPVWVFFSNAEPLADLRDLRGERVAVGPDGSGVRALAMGLLEDNGVADDVELSALTGQAAADALTGGRIDAAIFVTSQETAYVRALLLDDRVTALSFVRAEAYARRRRYLSDVTLPRGAVDLAQDAPAHDVTLIAPAAALVVKADLHPAIQSLLLQAASETFRPGDLLAPPGAFPSRDLVSFPLAREAERYYERGGPSFLRRYLPFWAANLVERLWLLAIPAATLLYPLVKSAPPLYRWQVKRRIHRWYKELRRLETEGRRTAGVAAVGEVRSSLKHMLTEVGALKVPLSYNDDLYRLQAHIRMVDAIVAETGEAETGAAV